MRTGREKSTRNWLGGRAREIDVSVPLRGTHRKLEIDKRDKTEK